jgi:hypothetical protein
VKSRTLCTSGVIWACNLRELIAGYLSHLDRAPAPLCRRTDGCRVREERARRKYQQCESLAWVALAALAALAASPTIALGITPVSPALARRCCSSPPRRMGPKAQVALLSLAICIAVVHSAAFNVLYEDGAKGKVSARSDAAAGAIARSRTLTKSLRAQVVAALQQQGYTIRTGRDKFGFLVVVPKTGPAGAAGDDSHLAAITAVKGVVAAAPETYMKPYQANAGTCPGENRSTTIFQHQPYRLCIWTCCNTSC